MGTTANVTANVEATESNVVVYEVQDFIKVKEFTQVVKEIRANANGYKYVTFITAGNIAENVYFSKGAAEEVGPAKTPIGKGFFKELVVSEYARESDGVIMMKLSRKGGNRLELDDEFFS